MSSGKIVQLLNSANSMGIITRHLPLPQAERRSPPSPQISGGRRRKEVANGSKSTPHLKNQGKEKEKATRTGTTQNEKQQQPRTTTTGFTGKRQLQKAAQ